jgi:hypothetical protein
MRLMRKHDPQTREDGFHNLLPVAAEHVTELIDEFNAEHDDHGLRCWLLELLGAARSPQAFDLLAEQLHSTDESLSWWAARGLEQLDTKDARRLLWEFTSGRRPGSQSG